MIAEHSWRMLRSNWFLRQLDVSYNRFHRHPLYRHWSMQAYDNPLAHRAEIIPEKIMEWVMLAVVAIPVLGLLINIILGNDVFQVISLMFGIVTFLALMILSVLGSGLSTLLAALPIAQERASGRWELLMMLPRDRANVLVMRISSILYPYRPILATLDVLQNLAGFISVLAIGILTDTSQDMVSLCFLYALPLLLVLSWERRQDHVLSLTAGALVGLRYDGQQAFRNALVSAGLIMSLRIMFAMLAFVATGTSGSLIALIPTFIAGPAMLPIAGVNFFPALVSILIYYALREGLIALLWQQTIESMSESYSTI